MEKANRSFGASEIAREIIKSEGTNLHLFANNQEETWTVVRV